jgi:CubicO group peptidase (beta-lactamase class C family)
VESSAAPDDLVCDGTACLSPSIFLRRLHEQLDGKVVGYVGFVGDAPVLMSGQARKDTDPPGLPMGPDVLLNTASVGKIFTTVVVLKTLAGHGLSVDTAIGPYLPADWTRGPGIDTVTFRELLTHRAGFRTDSGGVFTNENAARDQVATGVLDISKTIRSYNNINFTIMRDLLPQLDQAPPGSPDQWFTDRVQRDVFDPVGVHSATCAEPVDPMLYYPRPTDASAAGKVPPVGPAACSSGGWFITATDLFTVLRGIDNGSIRPPDLTAQMDGGCLGWDGCDALHGRSKGGGFGDRTSVFEVDFRIIAGVPIVLATNSPAAQPLEPLVDLALLPATSTQH